MFGFRVLGLGFRVEGLGFWVRFWGLEVLVKEVKALICVKGAVVSFSIPLVRGVKGVYGFCGFRCVGFEV